MTIIAKLCTIAFGSAFYIKGETKTKFLGEPNKNWKYAMGIPIGVIGALSAWSLYPLLALLTYFIACELGYGDNNPLTKMVGKRWAIVIHGTAVGLASFPLIGFWAILAAAISGITFDVVHKLDDAGKVKEPFVAIIRAIGGTVCLIF